MVAHPGCDRFAKRARLIKKQVEEKERTSREHAAAWTLQRAWTRRIEREKMQIRFQLRRKVPHCSYPTQEYDYCTVSVELTIITMCWLHAH